jgi:hypothetical protein
MEIIDGALDGYEGVRVGYVGGRGDEPDSVALLENGRFNEGGCFGGGKHGGRG